MATATIDSTNPSVTVNLAVLQKCLDRILDHARRNQPTHIAPDEYVLLNELLNATTTGLGAGNTVASITINY